jgi:hypothetical protein
VLINPRIRRQLRADLEGVSPALSGSDASGHALPVYFFRIRNGRYSGASNQGTELADREAAWHEMTSVCADIVSGISRKLRPDSEWEMELLDESRRPVFRIRLVAESLDEIKAK